MRLSSCPRASADGRTDSARKRAGRRAWATPGTPRRLPPGARSAMIARDRRRPQVSQAAHALLTPCWAHGVCPPSRAAARPGGRCLTGPPVLPSARRRGWEDRQRAQARWQEGMGSSRRAATPAAGCAVCDDCAGSAPCAGLPSRACPPDAVLDARRLSSQPRCRAAGRTVLMPAVASSRDRPIRPDGRRGSGVWRHDRNAARSSRHWCPCCGRS